MQSQQKEWREASRAVSITQQRQQKSGMRMFKRYVVREEGVIRGAGNHARVTRKSSVVERRKPVVLAYKRLASQRVITSRAHPGLAAAERNAQNVNLNIGEPSGAVAGACVQREGESAQKYVYAGKVGYEMRGRRHGAYGMPEPCAAAATVAYAGRVAKTGTIERAECSALCERCSERVCKPGKR